MATAEQMMQELAALRQELARQEQQHRQDLEQVRTESQARVNEATQAALAAQGQLSSIPNVVKELGQSFQEALKEQGKQLTDALEKSGSGDKGKLVLVDTKGLGKPSTFSGDADQFLPWRHRMSAYVCSIYPELRDVLEWCEERDESISTEELNATFGEEADEIDRVPKLFDKSVELSSALQMVTSKEPFAIVINCQTNGFEAWRRLTRRYDPATSPRKRSMLKTVISPQKQKLENLPQAIEEWLDAIASYEKRKDASGNRTKIPEDIKTAALESMLPQDLEAHVQLNQSKFSGFDDLLEEVTRYVEHRTGKSLKSFSTTQAAGKDALGDPMDVSSVGKGHQGKGQQKGTKFLGTCNNCGKQGHKAVDCWQPQRGKGSYSKQGPGKGTQKGQSSKGSKGSKGNKGSKGKGKTQGGKSKGKTKSKGKGKGKSANSLEEASASNSNQEDWNEGGDQGEESWEQGEWGDDQGWEEWQEDGDWKEGNGLLIGGLEKDEEKGKEEEREKRNKDKKKREERKGESSAAVLGPGGSGSPVVRMSGFGDRLRDAGLDPEQLQGLNDDEAQELQDARWKVWRRYRLDEPKHGAQNLRSRQRRRQRPKRERRKKAKGEGEEVGAKAKRKGEGQHGCFARCAAKT